MENKFRIKREFADAKIITKDKSRNDVLITAQNFNDYFAGLMFENGQGHLLEPNPLFTHEIAEKKTFVQMNDNTILLTSEPQPDETKVSEPKQRKRELRSDVGRQRKPKK